MLNEASKEGFTPVNDDGLASDSESVNEDLDMRAVSQNCNETINDESDPNKRSFCDRMGTIQRRDAQNFANLYK